MEQAERLKENYRINCPGCPLPPDTWFELTDEQRENAESAWPSWKFGILPPAEYNRLFRE